MNTLNDSSRKKLATVDPNLQLVVNRAAQILSNSDVFFIVTQGLRTADEQAQLYGKGRTAAEMSAKDLPVSYAKPNERKVTWTLKSNHMTGRAVDLAPLLNGKLEWDENGRLDLWPKISKAMKTAASEFNIPLEWGGDWSGKNLDRPHFELPAIKARAV